MSKFSGPKYYTRYNELSTGKKLYCPTYRGRAILMTMIPAKPWFYPTADEAQQHALRHAEKKKQQVRRLNDDDYRDKILARYSRVMAAKIAETEKQEEGNE